MIDTLLNKHLKQKYMQHFKIGDKVKKNNGYAFDGIIVAIFVNTKNEQRIVAELEGNGMLHIFSPSQLSIRTCLK